MNSSIVYFTEEISSESLLNIYKVLNFHPIGKVGFKISTGEPPHSNYLRPELLKDIVQYENGTIVECNTAYKGRRSATESHIQVIKEHGFDKIGPVDILDEFGDHPLDVENGYHFYFNLVGTKFYGYDAYVVISHFKGHEMAGFGGALKNISIGFASAHGKKLIHNIGRNLPELLPASDEFLECMADACESIIHSNVGRNIVYINVMNNISIDCDCNGHPAEPKIPDIGIAASYDPVALDRFCLNKIYEIGSPMADDFLNRLHKQNGEYLLDCCEKLGVGNQSYDELILQ